ncbi:MAG: ABC transporter substrate-binding protein [Pseudomonadota bacterium]
MQRKTVFGVVAVFLFFFAMFPVVNAQGADKIVIGMPTSLTFLEGKEAAKAVQMAVDEINGQGGVNVGGTKMEFTVEGLDIRDAAPGVPVPEALLGMEKLILEKKPTALVVGPFRSEALTAGMDMLAKYKTPMIGTIAMTPKSEEMVTQDPKYKYIFRTCLNAKYLVGYLAGGMKHLNAQFGFNRVFIMNQDVAWARATAGIMKGIFEKMGWEVVGEAVFPIGASDYSSSLTKAKLNNAQVIMPIFDMPQSGILVKQWRGMRIPAVMAGFVSPVVGSNSWKAFDGKIDGMINSVFEIGSLPSTKLPAAKAFYDAYKAKYGEEIQAGHGVAPSYVAVYLLKEAIEKAGSLDGDAIVAALEKIETDTAIGHVTFSPGHQVVYGEDPAKTALAALFQWTDKGERMIVYPESLAEGTIALPAGMKSAK